MYFIYALGNTDSWLLVVMAFDHYVAICDPFHYVTTMSHCRCILLVAFSCSLPHFHSLLHTLLLSQLTFCDSNIIHHFLCDLSPLMKLSCSPTFVNEIVLMTEASAFLVSPFLCIAFSYIRILIMVLKIPSTSGKCKAFSTCGSHLTVVTLFYGSIFYVYLQPVTTYTVRDHVATIVYTVLSSMLNPFIYSLRNKDLNQGPRKLVGRRKPQTTPSWCIHKGIFPIWIWFLLALGEQASSWRLAFLTHMRIGIVVNYIHWWTHYLTLLLLKSRCSSLFLLFFMKIHHIASSRWDALNQSFSHRYFLNKFLFSRLILKNPSHFSILLKIIT